MLNLLKGSDHAAYNEIYRRYFYVLYVHAYKKLGDEEQAKDVVQDVFASLWFKRDTNLPITNTAGYLFTAVRNKVFGIFAHQQVVEKYAESVQVYLKTHADVSTDYLIREKEFQAYIEKAIRELPPKMKLIFELSRKEQLSHKEIAEQLATTENNVSKQLNSALRVLRTKLGFLVGFFLI